MSDWQRESGGYGIDRFNTDEDAEEREDEPDYCHYCGLSGHHIEHCADFIADQTEAAQRDAATDKSDWPL